MSNLISEDLPALVGMKFRVTKNIGWWSKDKVIEVKSFDAEKLEVRFAVGCITLNGLLMNIKLGNYEPIPTPPQEI